MGILDYITQNFVLIFELVGLLFLSFISVHINGETKKITRVTILVLFLESLATYIELWTQSFETLSIARPLLTSVKYALYPIALILCMQIISPISKDNKVKFSIIAIPATISIPFYLTSQWTWIIFFYNDLNYYCGGPLKLWPYVVFAFYLIVFIVQNILYLKNLDNKSKLVVLFILLGPLVGVGLYFATVQNADYSPIFASTIVLYYTFTYIYRAGIDTLTGLYNRQSFYQDMKHLTKKAAIVSIDMNELKYYNDTFGHYKGDEALKAVSEVLISGCKEHGKAYRVGGDEFVIIYNNLSESEVIKNVEDMKNVLSQTEYSCAFGYAMKEEKTAHDTLIEADEAMYKDKKNMKKERAS